MELKLWILTCLWKFNVNRITEPYWYTVLDSLRSPFGSPQMLWAVQITPCLFYFNGHLAVRVKSGIIVHLHSHAKFLRDFLSVPQIPNNRESPSFRVMSVQVSQMPENRKNKNGNANLHFTAPSVPQNNSGPSAPTKLKKVSQVILW